MRIDERLEWNTNASGQRVVRAEGGRVKRQSMGRSLVYGRRETARMSLLREDEFAEFVDIDVETSEYGITWNSISPAR